MRLNRPKYIVVHTAAFDGEADVREIDRWHRLRKPKPLKRDAYWRSQWNPELTSFGYHYLIPLAGFTRAGRHEQEPGAHCVNEGMNFQSIGVCFEGHGDLYDFSENQYSAFFHLVEGIRRRHPDLARKGSAALIGHREARGVRKTCPGLRVDMEAFRRRLGLHIAADDLLSKLEPFPV